jgi:hypothetical protein
VETCGVCGQTSVVDGTWHDVDGQNVCPACQERTTCNESWEEFESWDSPRGGFRDKPVTMVAYRYQHIDDRSFLCVALSREDALFQRDVWLGREKETDLLMELTWNGGKNRIRVRKDLSAVDIIGLDSGDVEVYFSSTQEAVHLVTTAVRARFTCAGHPGAFVGWSHDEGFADEDEEVS